MPRGARILPEIGVLHIITRGNNRQKVFKDDADYKKYLWLLGLYKEEHGFKLYHYCLMSNHVHLIIETSRKTNLPKMMKQINLSYMHHFRKKYKYFGHFWQDRYKSLLIEKDSYLLSCGKYIELNPVRARIVSRPDEYRWHSYNVYSGMGEDKLIAFDPVYESLGKTQNERAEKYKELTCENINLNSRFIGSESFVKDQEEKFGVRNIGVR